MPHAHGTPSGSIKALLWLYEGAIKALEGSIKALSRPNEGWHMPGSQAPLVLLALYQGSIKAQLGLCEEALSAAYAWISGTTCSLGHI